MTTRHRDLFLDTASAWLCDSYHLDLRYLVQHEADGAVLLQATLRFDPLPALRDSAFHVRSGYLGAGQLQFAKVSREDALTIIRKAVQGEIEILGKSLHIPPGDVEFHSETVHVQRFFSELHLRVSGPPSKASADAVKAEIDNGLRNGDPPFDGVEDLLGWLSLPNPQENGVQSTINIRVGPPVDTVFSASKLADDQFLVTLFAHPKFDTSRAGLSIVSTPHNGLLNRRRISHLVVWKKPRSGKRVGSVKLSLPGAENVLTMLSIGGATVRRQWHIDPLKARNVRYIATHCFDPDLRRTRADVFETTDSQRFEKAIGTLLFLLGFVPALQSETDAPDLILCTPNGKIVLVECTMATKDFSTKVGKLVDRRGALVAALAASNHFADVFAALICRLPADQIAAHSGEAIANKVILVTKENLVRGFERVRTPQNPDALLAEYQ